MRRLGIAGISVAALLMFVGACSDEGEAEDASYTVAVLRAVPSPPNMHFLDELRRDGFIEGQNLTILPEEPPDAAYPQPDEAREQLEQWIDEGVDAILAQFSSGATIAAELTDTVPILFIVNDPMAVGLVDDSERPEGNVTGVTFRVPVDRTLSLAQRAVPDLTTVGLLLPEDDPAAEPFRDDADDAATELGLDLVEASFGDGGVDAAVDRLAAAEVQAVLVANAPTAVRAGPEIEAAVTRHGLPLVANTDFVPGAVVVLSPDADVVNQQLARQLSRILRGAPASDIPVENPRAFRVILDAAKAEALGLPPFPDDLVREADEVRR